MSELFQVVWVGNQNPTNHDSLSEAIAYARNVIGEGFQINHGMGMPPAPNGDQTDDYPFGEGKQHLGDVLHIRTNDSLSTTFLTKYACGHEHYLFQVKGCQSWFRTDVVIEGPVAILVGAIDSYSMDEIKIVDPLLCEEMRKLGVRYVNLDGDDFRGPVALSEQSLQDLIALGRTD